MKTLTAALLLFSIIFPAVAQAGEIDGIWRNTDMAKFGRLTVLENGSTIFLVGSLNSDGYSETYEYCALSGTQKANSIKLEDSALCAIDISATMTFHTSNSATLKVDHCRPKYSGSYCIFPSGGSFSIIKLATRRYNGNVW